MRKPKPNVNAADLLLYAHFSQLAYSEDILELMPENWRVGDLKRFEFRLASSRGSMGQSSAALADLFNSNPNAYVFSNKVMKQVVVAFKGTAATNFADLKDDFEIATGGYPKLAAASEAFLESVKTSYPGWQIVLTGHSLGGYYATRAALKLDVPAFVFDAPGLPVGAHLPHAAKVKQLVTNIVVSPNFVNCTGSQMGDLYVIAAPTSRSMEARNWNPVLQDVFQRAVGKFDIKAMLKEKVVPQVVSYGSRLVGFPVGADRVKQIIEGAEKILGKDAKENPDNKKLEERVHHTLATHSLTYIYACIVENGAQFVRVQEDKWLTPGEFWKQDLKNFVDLHKKIKHEDAQSSDASPRKISPLQQDNKIVKFIFALVVAGIVYKAKNNNLLQAVILVGLGGAFYLKSQNHPLINHLSLLLHGAKAEDKSATTNGAHLDAAPAAGMKQG